MASESVVYRILKVCQCDCLLCKLGTHCPVCWLDQFGRAPTPAAPAEEGKP